MRAETEKAKTLLEGEKRTLVLCKGGETFSSGERGVKTLLSLFDEGKSFSGFCAADKAVGKGAAVLFVLLGVSEVYAGVMSEKAKTLLEKNGVSVYAALTVPSILNRRGDGLCPIESALGETESLSEAVEIIKATLKKMAQKQ